jgi:Transglutaminase-like superfamily
VVLDLPVPLTVTERLRGTAAVAAASLILTATRARPARIRAVLRLLNAGATPAPLALAQRCRAVVTTVSLRAASDHGCLSRSLAVLVACRLAGHTVTWRVGVASPPPSSHAWVEADDTPVGERFDPCLLYRPIITVCPAERIAQ